MCAGSGVPPIPDDRAWRELNPGEHESDERRPEDGEVLRRIRMEEIVV
jgi:hypothetical protein